MRRVRFGQGSSSKQPTFVQARAAILDVLRARGWRVVGLKVPHATTQWGDRRLWFKSQAVWVSEGSSHSLGNARSLWADDIRSMPAEQWVNRFAGG